MHLIAPCPAAVVALLHCCNSCNVALLNYCYYCTSLQPAAVALLHCSQFTVAVDLNCKTLHRSSRHSATNTAQHRVHCTGNAAQPRYCICWLCSEFYFTALPSHCRGQWSTPPIMMIMMIIMIIMIIMMPMMMIIMILFTCQWWDTFAAAANLAFLESHLGLRCVLKLNSQSLEDLMWRVS